MSAFARRWRDWATLLVGVCLCSSPWVSGAATNEPSFASAWLAGLWIVTAALRALLDAGPNAGAAARVGIGAWLLASPLVLNFADSAMMWSAWLAGALTVSLADIPSLVFDLRNWLWAKRLSRRTRMISPQEIIAYADPEEHLPDPELLGRRIVERACRIHHTLRSRPPEIEAEMCAIGYRACAEDMITLVRLVEKELPEAGLLRRLRLKAARASAARSLSRAYGMLPRKPRRPSPHGEGIT